jgi:hypothetical protein
MKRVASGEYRYQTPASFLRVPEFRPVRVFLGPWFADRTACRKASKSGSFEVSSALRTKPDFLRRSTVNNVDRLLAESTLKNDFLIIVCSLYDDSPGNGKSSLNHGVKDGFFSLIRDLPFLVLAVLRGVMA